MSEHKFPLDAEQIVRLTAAVLWELRQAPSIASSKNRLDAVILRLADAIGLPLATEVAPAIAPREEPPRRGPRGSTATHDLRVKDYPALTVAEPTDSRTRYTLAGCYEE